MPYLEAITIHASRPAELAQFWSLALGLPIDPADVTAIADGTLSDRESVLLGRREGLHVWVSPASEMPELGGRVHLDVRLDDGLGAQDLLDAGATLVWDEPQGRWSVYTDPEGNRFCAVPATGQP